MWPVGEMVATIEGTEPVRDVSPATASCWSSSHRDPLAAEALNDAARKRSRPVPLIAVEGTDRQGAVEGGTEPIGSLLLAIDRDASSTSAAVRVVVWTSVAAGRCGPWTVRRATAGR